MIIQGVPSVKQQKSNAVAQKQSYLFHPTLSKPKCVLEAVVYLKNQIQTAQKRKQIFEYQKHLSPLSFTRSEQKMYHI